MTAISQALSAALLHFIWQGAVVALLLWITLVLLRRSSPNARYAASGVALALMAVLPIATAWVVWRRPASISGALTVVLSAPAARVIAFSPRLWLSVLREWTLPLWAIGVAVFAIRLALAWRHVAILRRQAEAADAATSQAALQVARRMSVMQPVSVLVSKLADAPSVIGWLRPAILMPAAALAGLDVGQLEAILAHELAHIRRRDYLVNVLQGVVETLLFYHPAVWWVSSRMRQEREFCCDDLVVRHCGGVARYARALTRLERLRAAPGPALAVNGGTLLYRIQRLTGVVSDCAPSRLPAILAIVAFAVSIPIASHRVHASPQATKVDAVAAAMPVQTSKPGLAPASSENGMVAMSVDQSPQPAPKPLPPQGTRSQNPFEPIPQAPEKPKPEPPNTQIQTVARERPPADIIEAIELRGSRRFPQDKLRAMISSKPGDPYSEDALHRDFILLGDTGLFDDIRVEREAGQKGWIIRYILVERRVESGRISFGGIATVKTIKTGVYCHGNYSVDQVIECR